MTHAEAIEKVKKLMRLAESPVKAEAELAAAKASEIMSRYELDAAAIELSNPTQAKEDIADFGEDPLDEMRVVASWKSRLSVVVSSLHGCQCYKRGGSLNLIGRPSDVATVRYLYSWICRQIELVVASEGLGHSKNYKNNFRLGMVDTIAVRMRDAKKVAEQQFRQETVAACSTTALVLVENAIVLRQQHYEEAVAFGKAKLHLRTQHGYRPRHNDAGRTAGREAGQHVQFNGTRRTIQRSATQLNS